MADPARGSRGSGLPPPPPPPPPPSGTRMNIIPIARAHLCALLFLDDTSFKSVLCILRVPLASDGKLGKLKNCMLSPPPTPSHVRVAVHGSQGGGGGGGNASNEVLFL